MIEIALKFPVPEAVLGLLFVCITVVLVTLINRAHNK